MNQENSPDVRFWLSRKFWFVILIAGVFLALALTKTMVFTTDQALEFLKWLLALALGAHAATDITSLVAGAFGKDTKPQAETQLMTPEALEELAERSAKLALEYLDLEPDEDEFAPEGPDDE